MRLLRTSKSSNANKLAFLGAQAFLTGSICRHVNPAAGFSSVSIGSTDTHFKYFTNSGNNRVMVRSATGARPTASASNSRLFSGTMDGPTLTNVNKEVGSFLPSFLPAVLNQSD